MSNPPPVSVIMTVYNGEQYVAQAIDSILQQSFREFELIIIDDGSEDRTPEVLAEAQTDSRIRVISLPRLGRIPALNMAWKEARGDYVAILDADDLMKPERLEKQLAFMRRHPNVGLVGTRSCILDERRGTEQILHRPLTDDELRTYLARRNPIVHSSVMMPRRVLEEVGGYDERFDKAHDYEIYVRIANAYQLAILPDVLTTKRKHERAYFTTRFPMWNHYWDHVIIRWRAWRRFSRSIPELKYVFFEPIATWLYAWLRVALAKTGRS